MNLSLCTISFRHQLISIEQIAQWAAAHHFQGIELWGIHAQNLSNQPQYNQSWLNGYGLKASMISDYLPVQGTEAATYYKVQKCCRLARLWGAGKIRTFAGNKASHTVSEKERNEIENRLAHICEWVAEHNLQLIIEIHPDTLADTVDSTERLIHNIDHPCLKINFDVLHVWEAHSDPIESLIRLKPHVNHFHLKNIHSRSQLDVFNPPNVYASSGNREGMVPLMEGAVDYQHFLSFVFGSTCTEFMTTDASLEWFGDHVQHVLNNDRYQIQQIQQKEMQFQQLTGQA